MPPGRKPTRSREEFVEAGIEFADAQGLSALTLRALGCAMGASTTAVYRYFRDKGDLIVAMREHLLTSAMDSLDLTSQAPKDLLLATALAYRATVRAHPCLSQIMTLPANEGDTGVAVQIHVLTQLERMGLTGALLARGYQQLESFTVGSCIFDYADAPRHALDRHERFTTLGHPTIVTALGSVTAVEANNEAAFEATVRTLIDALEREATS